MDPRDQLWQKAYDTFYDSYFQELFGDALTSRWRTIDEVAKLLVAATATGSVVSAWTLWGTPEGRIGWAVIAGAAAVMSIFHATLGVPAKLRDWTEVKQSFTTLRIDIETFRHNMAIDSAFDLAAYTSTYNKLRDRYRDAMARIQNDMFRTRRRAEKIQDYLDGTVIKQDGE